VVLHHRNPGRVGRSSRWGAEIFSFRGEIKMLTALLAVLAAILPYTATGNRRILLVFGVPFGLMAIWSLRHIWRRARLG
jgi:hypothetical protein